MYWLANILDKILFIFLVQRWRILSDKLCRWAHKYWCPHRHIQISLINRLPMIDMSWVICYMLFIEIRTIKLPVVLSASPLVCTVFTSHQYVPWCLSITTSFCLSNHWICIHCACLNQFFYLHNRCNAPEFDILIGHCVQAGVNYE